MTFLRKCEFVCKRLAGTNCRACGEMTCMAFGLGLAVGAGALEDA